VLIFIGGAARAGKGMLVRRLLAELRLPYLNLDVLKMGIARGIPEYRLDPNAGAPAVAERLWPLVREMSASLLVDRIDYVIEGELLPRQVAALWNAHPGRIKACFVGYATIAPERKLAQIRAHGGLPNDWPNEYDDTALLTIIRREIAFSQLVRAECARHNIRYFDSSDDFLGTLDTVVAYVREAVTLARRLPASHSP
jgi:hypothetical protein